MKKKDFLVMLLRDIQLMASDGHGIIGRGCTERG